jgi:hypothetical protein
MDFSKLENAIVARLKAVPELSRSRVQAWPDRADLEGIVIADSCVFVRFSDLSLDPQLSNNRTPLQPGVITVQIEWLTKHLRSNGAHGYLPSIHKAISRWPKTADPRIIDPPLFLDSMGFQLTGYELIGQADGLWRWGSEYVSSVILMDG